MNCYNCYHRIPPQHPDRNLDALDTLSLFARCFYKWAETTSVDLEGLIPTEPGNEPADQIRIEIEQSITILINALHKEKKPQESNPEQLTLF